jgi:tetratricopeptide (TPR) repeat protein
MPLALELAAGWSSVLPVAQIAAELQRGIDILQTELRDVPERHRSIRATFDLTWQRLDAAEREVFMRLSVFRGGFTREAAAAIAGADRNHLRSFGNKALIEVVEGGRYDTHQLLCQFGAEKLAAAGAEAGTEAQHAVYFAAFMAECWQDMRTNRQLEALERVAADFENVRAAWLHAVSLGDWEKLARFLDPLRFYCEVRTPAQIGVELLEHAVQAVRAAPPTPETELTLGRLLARLSWFYHRVGLGDKSAAAGDEAIGILRQHDSPEDMLAALYSRNCAAMYYRQTDINARIVQEGLSLVRSLPDRYWEAHFLTLLVIWDTHIDTDAVPARLNAEAALAIFEGVGDRWGSRRCYELLGEIEEAQRNYTQAAFHFQQSLSLAQTFGYHLHSGANSTFLARIAFRQGNVAAARLHLCEALRTVLNAGFLGLSTFSLVVAAQMLAEQNSLTQAVEILGAIDKHLTPFHDADRLAHILGAELASKMNTKDFAAAWACGQKRELRTVIQEMLMELMDAADSAVPPIA